MPYEPDTEETAGIGETPGPRAAGAPAEDVTVRGAREARRVRVDPGGPVLIEGPVEVVDGQGRLHTSDRFVVAVCACGLSSIHPWCDTSHRARSRSASGSGQGCPRAGRAAVDTARKEDGT